MTFRLTLTFTILSAACKLFTLLHIHWTKWPLVKTPKSDPPSPTKIVSWVFLILKECIAIELCNYSKVCLDWYFDTDHSAFLLTDTHCSMVSKMPTVRNARSLVTSRELPSGLRIWGKRPAESIVLSGSNERWHRQRVRRERQSNSRTRRPWYAIRTFDVSNNGQPP